MIVTVVYARPGREIELRVDVEPGTTVGQAIAASGVLALEPQLQRQALDVGVWNRVARLGDVAREGDRIEIYRPLLADPKEARRIRAEIRRRRRPGGLA